MSANSASNAMQKSKKLPKRKVVIVDDDRFIREILNLILRQQEFDIIGSADDGERGLKMIQRYNPELVFLDINMPGMDGMEVLAKVRADHPDTQVIMISGAATVDKVKSAIAAGAVGFVVKPFSPEAVLTTLQRAKIVD